MFKCRYLDKLVWHYNVLRNLSIHLISVSSIVSVVISSITATLSRDLHISSEIPALFYAFKRNFLKGLVD